MVKVRKDIARLTLVFFVNLLFSLLISSAYKGYLMEYNIPDKIKQLLVAPDIMNIAMLAVVGILIIISAESLAIGIDNPLTLVISPIPVLLLHLYRTLNYIDIDLGFIDLKSLFVIILYGLLITTYILKLIFFGIFWCYVKEDTKVKNKKIKQKVEKQKEEDKDDIFNEYIEDNKDEDNNDYKVSFQDDDNQIEEQKAGKFL